MSGVLKSLDGKKTYIGALAFVALAFYQFYSGMTQEALQSLVAAWTALGLRSAITKLQS